MDKRLYQVCREGLQFALKYPEEITLMAAKTRKSYKGHTPNMVAFASLIQAVHTFCKKHGTTPDVFIHDLQSEFGSTMKEYHQLLASLRAEHSKSGLMLDVENTDYDLGKFALTPSKYLSSLQAVDLFLWLRQRSERIKSPGLRESLIKVSDPFYISRASSQMIWAGWAVKISTADLSEADLKRGREILNTMELKHRERLKEFKREKLEEGKRR